jgi:V/A-type H+-transporting ATPase subunit F
MSFSQTLYRDLGTSGFSLFYFEISIGVFIMKIFLISDNTDTRTGMRLVGVDGVLVHEKDELNTALNNVINDRDIGILLINEKLARQFPDIIDDIKLTRKLPLIVEIPDRHGFGRDTDFISEYIREAIGVKL